MAHESLPGLVRIEELQRLVAKRRGKISLRRAAAEIGISFNTLARVERGHLPDLDTLLRILGWLGVSIQEIAGPAPAMERSTPDVITDHLNADRALTPEAAEKIASMVASMYTALASNGSEAGTAMHLRSARVFLPAASEKLASMLADMEKALVTGASHGAAKRLQGRG